MASNRKPGPLGTGGQHELIDDGTLIRLASPTPGPLCVSRSSRPASGEWLKRSSGTAWSSLPALQQGDSGENVRKLQSFLNFRLELYPALKEDGKFGSLTRQAVAEYQSTRGLKADGIVGKDTWYDLIETAKPRQSAQVNPDRSPEYSLLQASENVMDWSIEMKCEYVASQLPARLASHLRPQFAPVMPAHYLGPILIRLAETRLFDVAKRLGHQEIAIPWAEGLSELVHPTVLTVLATTKADLDEAVGSLAETFRKLGPATLLQTLVEIRSVGKGATQKMPKQAPTSTKKAQTEAKTWVKFELVDMEGNPVPNKRYIVTLPSGSTQQGSLDSKGSVRFDGIDEGTCTITFPDYDQDAWDWA